MLSKFRFFSTKQLTLVATAKCKTQRRLGICLELTHSEQSAVRESPEYSQASSWRDGDLMICHSRAKHDMSPSGSAIALPGGGHTENRVIQVELVCLVGLNEVGSTNFSGSYQVRAELHEAQSLRLLLNGNPR